MLRRPLICGLWILLAGLAVAEGQVPDHVPTPEERARFRGRRSFNPADPSSPVEGPPPGVMATPPAPVAPAPTPFTPPAPVAPNAPAVTPQPAALLPPTAPPVPPVVTYRDGLLTVQAANSTLGSVLTAIRNKTGIEFEGGEGAKDLVALSLGPAPEGEVLSAIFTGSSFDFVALGRPDSPGIVQRVILRPNSKSGGPVAVEVQQQPKVVQNGDEEENVPEEQTVEQPQDMPIQPPPQAFAQPNLPEQKPQGDPSRAPRKQPPL